MRGVTMVGLAVLRLLDERSQHPYEMRQRMREQGLDHLIKITNGTLYHAFDVLTKAELIEMVETTREGRRPERTIYAITDAGREVAVGRLRELLSMPEPEYATFCAALAFLSLLSMDDAAAQLEQRAVLVEAKLAAATTSMDALVKRGAAGIDVVEIRHVQAHLRADLDLTVALVEDIRAGRLRWPADGHGRREGPHG